MLTIQWLKRRYLKTTVMATSYLYAMASWAGTTDDAMDTLSNNLDALGLKVYTILKGPYAALALFVLMIVVGSKLGQMSMSTIVIMIIAAAVFYAYAPELIWSIFGSGEG